MTTGQRLRDFTELGERPALFGNAGAGMNSYDSRCRGDAAGLKILVGPSPLRFRCAKTRQVDLTTAPERIEQSQPICGFMAIGIVDRNRVRENSIAHPERVG